ncbi:hypothetical protein LUZ60_001745 [Juncus effusus]|nr:hypothetical protein LUZ60_001745 [Juncus effusus]
MAALTQLLINSNFQNKFISSISSSPKSGFNNVSILSQSKLNSLPKFQCGNIKYCTTLRTGTVKPLRAVPGKDGIVPVEQDDDGVSLGTMKLPGNTDLARFESLLFQWANSLCQGSNLPLPVPLKVDKIQGGVRLGFINVDEGKINVLVYIDCVVFPSKDGSEPMFLATRNGPMKDNAPPGEPRIMQSLLLALQKSVQIARL